MRDSENIDCVDVVKVEWDEVDEGNLLLKYDLRNGNCINIGEKYFFFKKFDRFGLFLG